MTKVTRPLFVMALVLIMLLVADVARADIRDWSAIVNEAECEVHPSGKPVGVYIDGNEVAWLESGSGDVYKNPGPVTVEVRVYLQRDNVESAVFVFDCGVPPSPSTTTSTTLPPPTTTTEPPPAPAPTTTTAPPETTTTTTKPPPAVEDPDPQPEVETTTTTAAPVETTTTTVAPAPTPDPNCGPDTLPCTGPSDVTRAAAAIGGSLLLLGLGMLAATRQRG